MGRRQREGNRGFLVQSMILASASIITRLIGLVYRIPLTNILGDEGNGFYSVAFEIYAVALLISSYSLPLAVSKLVAVRVAKGERKNAFRVFKGALVFAIVIGTAVGLILFFGANFIAGTIMSSPLSVYALRVLAPGILVVAVIGVVRGYLQGLGTMIPTAASQILEQIVNAIVSISAALYLIKVGKTAAEAANNPLLAPAYGAAGGTIGTVAGAVTAGLFLAFVMFAYKKIIRKQIRLDQNKRTEHYREIFIVLILTILPVILSTAIYNISQSLDLGIFNKIMSVQGHGEKEYTALWGIFSGKYLVLINVPLAMANALGVSIIPSLTAAVSTRNIKQIHRKITLAIRFAMLIAIPSFVGYLVLSSPLLQLLFGDERKTPAAMLSLGAITVVFYSLSTVTNAILQGLNKMTTPVKNAAISLGIHLASLFIMLVMLKWNIYAVVAANIVFSLSMCILNAHSISQACGYSQEIRVTFVIPAIAATIMGIATFAIHLILDILIGGKIATILALLVAVVIYGVAILLLGGLTEEEILVMPKGAMLVSIFKKLHLIKREY